MAITIESPKSEDAKAIADVYKNTWKKYRGRIKEELLKAIEDNEDKIIHQINSGNQLFLIAKENERIEGAIRGSIEFGGIAKISMLVVNPPSLGKGIGKKLLANFIRLLKGKGIYKVYLYTNINLIEAIGLYKSQGFRQVTPLEDFWFGEDYLLLEKKL